MLLVLTGSNGSSLETRRLLIGSKMEDQKRLAGLTFIRKIWIRSRLPKMLVAD